MRLSAEGAYLEHYGFIHDPFAARMPGFKFFSARRKQVLGQLHHLARYSQVMQVVTGPLGSGKSLLRQALIATSNKQTVQSIVITPDNLEASGILSQLAMTLGCPRHSTGSILSKAGQLAQQGQQIYLLVDDAHILENEDLLDLLTLAVGNAEGRVHVFLFAEPSLAPRLDALIPDRENCHTLALQPYNLEETSAYLAQRLEGAGSSLDCLTDEQIRQIHKRSGGWPGQINQSARELLIAALPSKGQRSTVGSRSPRLGLRLELPRLTWPSWPSWAAGYRNIGLPRLHLLAILAVLGLMAIALLLQETPTNSSTPTENRTAEDNSNRPETDINGNGQRLPLPLVAEDEPIVREPLPAAAGGESEVLQAPASRRPASTPPATAVPSARSTTPPALATPPAHGRSTPTPAPTPAPERPSAPSAPANNRPAASIAPPPAPTLASATHTGSSTGSGVTAAATAAWYLKQPATHYLLQVLGTRSEQTAQEILRQYGNQFRYFVKNHQGQPLYVVTYGSFSSKELALSAAQKLPPMLQTERAWARPFASVQQEIRPSRL